MVVEHGASVEYIRAAWSRITSESRDDSEAGGTFQLGHPRHASVFAPHRAHAIAFRDANARRRLRQLTGAKNGSQYIRRDAMRKQGKGILSSTCRVRSGYLHEKTSTIGPDHEKDVSRCTGHTNGDIQALAYAPSSSLPSLRVPGAPMSFILTESNSAISRVIHTAGLE